MASNCVPWYRVFSSPFSSALTEEEKACVIQQGKDSIGNVAANVHKYYTDSLTQDQLNEIDNFAKEQQGEVADDLGKIDTGCPYDLGGIGLPCFQNAADMIQYLAKWGAIVGIVIAATYVLFLFSTAKNLLRSN